VTGFVLRRLAVFAGTMLVASMVVFASLYLAPGNPIDFLLGNRPSTPAQRQGLIEQNHLDQPFLGRYLTWIGDALHGNFGESIQQHEPVSSLLRQALPTSLLLVTMTFLLVMALGLVIGGFTARRSKRLEDATSMAMSLSIATPTFVAAIFLISVFAVRLGWFPVFGQGSGFADRLHHLVLPAIALAVAWWPLVGNVVQTSMREEMSREHVEAAIVRGLPPSYVQRKHVLRNAAVPIITVSGLAVAGLIAGTAIVETTFQLNGIGGLLITSVQQKDFAVVQAIALILLTAFALTNLAVDVVAARLDPRIRAKMERR
jgi:peptide/nickel transport system permease protein